MQKRIFPYVILLIGLYVFTGGLATYAQDRLDRKVKVFFDCEVDDCDFVYIRSHIGLVDFVLDRTAADVHLLVTNTKNAAGGFNFQMIFFGQHSFASINDTLSCTMTANVTPYEAREKVLKTLQWGLLPFIARTRYYDQIALGMKEGNDLPSAKPAAGLVEDKWNFWVFNAGVDGNVVMDAIYDTRMLNGSISMNRTTPSQRISFSMAGNYTGSAYKINTTDALLVYKVVNTDYVFNHAFVSAINNHWSWAYTTSFSSNTFNNIRSRKYFGAGIEYAFFPYSDINTRFFTVNYRFEAQNNYYFDTTIFNKINEFLPGHRLEANLSVKQKWGNISAKLAYTNLLKDHQLNNLNYNLTLDLRISGGLSMYLYSNGALVHDQVYLAKGNASAEDILTKRRQLKSGYNFYTGVGLNFRFGSMMNNFVNPRFAGY